MKSHTPLRAMRAEAQPAPPDRPSQPPVFQKQCSYWHLVVDGDISGSLDVRGDYYITHVRFTAIVKRNTRILVGS